MKKLDSKSGSVGFKGKRFFFRLTSFLVLVTFSTQITWAQVPVLTQESYEPEKAASQTPDFSPNPQIPFVETSTQFLSQDSPLSEVRKEEIPQEEKKEEAKSLPDYETNRYTLENALDLLRPEFATAAVIDQPLSESDIETIRKYSVDEGIEIALVVLYGETVLFTAGSGDEIAASSAAREILAKATFVSHTHPDEHSKEGPTGPDLQAAGSQTQYLLTITQAYSFDQTGILETGDLAWFTQKYSEAIKAAGASHNQIQAREDLNQLIAEQDKLNQIEKEQWETWLAGGTISPTSSLKAADITTLPGYPYPYLMSGSSSGTNVNYNSYSENFGLVYDVTASGSYSGMVISFDNATTSDIETRDLSSLGSIVFGLQGDSSQLRVEFLDYDATNNDDQDKDVFILKNIASNSQKFWKINLSSLISNVDKTRIREIRLIVDQTAAGNKKTGSELIWINGLNLNPPSSPAVTSAPQATNQATAVLSGTKDAYTSVIINGVLAVPLDSSTSWTATVNLPAEGSNGFTIYSRNSILKASQSAYRTVIRDTVAPTAKVKINSDAAYATSTNVTLSLAGSSDATSGLDQMRFSSDGGNAWTAWENYVSPKSFTLPAGDGNKEILAQVQDKAGNIAATTSDTIILDTIKPAGSIAINDGASYTGSTAVTLTLNATDETSGIKDMRFSNDRGTTWTNWEAYTTSKSFTILSGDGTQYVHVQYRDNAGLITQLQDTIVLDTALPTGYFTVHDQHGSPWPYMRYTTVTLLPYFSDASGYQLRYSVDEGTNWSEWAHLGYYILTLPPGDGTKKIMVEVQDGVGNLASFSEDVFLDTVIPTGTILIQNGDLYTDSRDVILNLTGFDEGSGIDKMKFSTDGRQTWTAWESFAATKTLTLPAGDGVKEVYLNLMDAAGNMVSAVGPDPIIVDSIILDTLPPAGTITVNNGAQYINQTTVTLNLSATDAGSGVDKMSFSSDNVTYTTAENYTVTKSWTFLSGDGNKTVYVKFLDKSGKWSNPVSATVLLDTTAPTGSININSGASYASSTSVTLNLSALDGSGSGISQMRFSTDNIVWAPVETYASSKTLTLPSGEGNKTVYVKYYDRAGNVSAVYSKLIILDTLAPSGTITVNSGAQYITQTAVTLNLSATDAGSGLDQMSFSADNVTYTTAETYATTKSWTFSSGDGNKTVYVKFLDKSGKWSSPVSVTVLLDTVNPTGSININSGAVYATSRTVTLNLSGSDSGSGINTMSFSTDNTNWSTAETYAASKSYTLPTGDGNKTVYVKYFDKAGNVSAVFSKSIILDTVGPTGTIQVNNGVQYITQTAVTLNLSASDAGSGLDKMSFSSDNVTYTTAEAYVTTKSWTFSSGDGNKTVYVKFLDKSGKWSSPISKTVVLDTVKPTGSININSSAAYTSTANVTLNLAASDSRSGMDRMSFSTDNTNWSASEAYATSKSFVLPTGDGSKTVYVKYYDKAGNVSVVYSDSIILDTTAPVISNVLASNITSSGVTLTWTTNEVSDTQIEYGLTTSYGSSTTRNATLVSSHSQSLSTLQANTLYHYRVKSKDAAGNLKISSDFTFTTASSTATVAPPTVNSVSTYTNQTTLALSGTKSANTSIWINGVQRVSASSSTTWSYSEPLTVEGLNSFSIIAKDSQSNASTAVTTSTTRDTVLPTGSLNVNSGAAYTSSTTVTLNLSASDSGSGIDKMSFSSDNVTYSTAEAYATSKTYTLPSGDGTKTVYVKYFDKAGNVSLVYSKSIILDTLAPTGTITVNGGVQYINQIVATLNLSATDAGSGLDQMSFSTDNVTYTTAETYAATKSWTFSSGDGNKTVYVKFLDKVGNWASPVSVTVLLDTMVPTGSININSGATYATSQTVTLNLTGSDATSGIDKMSFSTDNTNWTSPEISASSKSFNLPAGDGNKTVYVKYSDKAGNASSVYSKSITLDTTAPGGSIKINNEDSYTTLRNVTLTLTASDATSGLDQIRFSTDSGQTWTAWEDFAASKSLTLPAGDGVKSVHYQIRDKAGLTSTFTDTIILNTTALELGLLSDAYVYAPNYSLRYRISGAGMETSVAEEAVTLERGWNTITRQAADPAGNVRQMTWRVYLDLNAERGQHFDYDANGNATRVTNFNNEDTLYEYDALNRLSLVTFPDGKTVRYGYDAIGNLSTIQDSHGITRYFYDIANRLSSISYPDGKTIYYDLDNAGQLIGLRYAGREIRYGYDAAGHLTSVTDGSDVTTYTYNNAGDLISTTLPNGVRTTNTYDSAGRLTDILHENTSGASPTLIARFHYTLDAAGQRTQMVETRPTGVRTVNYTYDEFGRLTQDIDSVNGTTKYVYDAAGNRLSMERIPVVINTQNLRVVTQYVYGIDNRLGSMTETKYDGAGSQFSSVTETYTYDAAGRMLQKITPTQVSYYEYDARGLLTRFNDGQNEVSYEYNGLGNRIAKIVNGERTEYMVNIAQAIPQVLAEMDSTGIVTKSYAFGLDRLSQTAGSSSQYFLSDALGSHIGLTDQAGAIEEIYRYDAFGNPQFEIGDSQTGFLYAGEQFDPETGLVYLRARYYNPVLGRFISRDPQYVGDNSQTQSYNPFIYVQNDPVNLVDPIGAIPLGVDSQVDRGVVTDNLTGKPYENPDFDSYLKALAVGGGILTVAAGALYAPEIAAAGAAVGAVTGNFGGNAAITAIGMTGCFTSPTCTGLLNYTLSNSQQLLKIATGGWSGYQIGAEMADYYGLKDFPGGLLAFAGTALGAVTSFFGGAPPGGTGDSVRNTFNLLMGNDAQSNQSNSSVPPPGGGGGGDIGGFFGNLFSGTKDFFRGLFSGIGNAVSSVVNGIANLFRGGVYMDKALEVIGENIKDIQGVSYDPVTGQIIMLSDASATVPEVPVDYFLAALKAVFGETQTAPGVSIDPVYDANGNIITSQELTVRFLGGIENTALGKAVYEADLLMKLIGAGQDNVTGAAIRQNGENISESYIASFIPGFKDLFTLSSEVTDVNLLLEPANLRFWFTPRQMDLVRSQNGDAFIFQENSVELQTEKLFFDSNGLTSTGEEDPRGTAFAQFFNGHFNELAALYPEFAELEKGMRAVALAKFIKDNRIPIDLNWLSRAQLTQVTTPTTTPLVIKERMITHQGTNQTVSMTLMGGVDYGLFDGRNFSYLLDSEGQAAALSTAALEARADDLQKNWQVEIGGKVYDATAFSLSPTQKDGSFHWQDTDLSYGTEGGFGLAFERYYDSFLSRESTALGYGWKNVPYELAFPVAKESTTFGSGGNQVTVDIAPKILFTDWSTHQLLEFIPYQRLSDGRIVYAPKDQKITRELFVLNADGSYTYLRDGNEILFSAEGVLQSLIDRNGNQISYIYDVQGKLIRIRDEISGHEISLTYNGAGHITQALGPDGRSIQYGYDAAPANLKTVTRSWIGRTTTFDYNADHQLTQARDYAGRVLFQNTFDEIGRLTTQTDFYGNQTDFAPNLLLQKTTANNSVTGATSTWQYNQNFQVTNQIDPFGNQVTFQYDANNLFGPVSATDAQGNTTYFSYDPFGNISQVTDMFGNATKYYYTRIAGNNRPIFVENPNGRGIAYAYDTNGNLIQIYEGARIVSVDASGNISVELSDFHTFMQYDSKGRLITKTNANGDAVQFNYDNAGNATLIRDGLDHDTTMAYILRNGITTSLVSSITDAIGRSVQYGYDSLKDLLTSVTTAAGTILYEYDLRDRLTRLQDELGRQVKWIYNELDQRIATINKSATGLTQNDIQVSYSYDQLGRLSAIAGPLGAITGFAYDLLNRLKRMFISEQAPVFGTLNDLFIGKVEPEQADLSFNLGTNMNQVIVRYKAEGDINFTQITLDNPVVGENKLNLTNLSEMTKYEVGLELTDNTGKTSYSRRHFFETGEIAPPVIQQIKVEGITENSATVRFEVSKEVTEINLSYHVLGEAKDNVYRIEGVHDGWVEVNLEPLRSGLNYKVEVTVKDRDGKNSLLKTIQFKTLGEPSPEDNVNYQQSEIKYGRVLYTSQTSVALSVENANVSNPFAESYGINIWDSQGNQVPGLTYSAAQFSNPPWGRVILISGLTPNTSYSYRLEMETRSDIPVVTGTFKTADGTDTTSPNLTSMQTYARDSESLVFVVKPTENILMMEVKLTDQATGEVKKYNFFNLTGGEFKELLLDGLEASHSYAIQWTMMDMAGRFSASAFALVVSTQAAEDETPPQVVERTVLSQTSTTATLKVVTNELLRKMKVQYRVVGSDEWMEQSVLETSDTYETTLTALDPSREYEYRYVLEDLSGNVLITDWEIL